VPGRLRTWRGIPNYSEPQEFGLSNANRPINHPFVGTRLRNNNGQNVLSKTAKANPILKGISGTAERSGR
jgi:hypothetical protein